MWHCNDRDLTRHESHRAACRGCKPKQKNVKTSSVNQHILLLFGDFYAAFTNILLLD